MLVCGTVQSTMDYTRRENPESNSKNSMCRNFWTNGRCNYGEKCIFAHVYNNNVNLNSSGIRNQASERQICRHFSFTGMCPYDRCKYVHQGFDKSEEIRDVNRERENSAIDVQTGVEETSNFKTRLCRRWNGANTCQFGDKCTYAHGRAELRREIGTTSRTVTTIIPTSNAAGKQPAVAADHNTPPPKAKVCPFRWNNNRKIIGIYGDWIDED